MNVHKAIKKQKFRYRRFILAISVLIVALPVILFYSKQENIFFIIYLLFIELLIILFVMYRMNNEFLDYKIDINKIRISTGFPPKLISIPCDKVTFIHAEGSDKDIRIVIMCSEKFRNRCVRPVSSNFLKNYPYAGYYYGKLKKKNWKKEYFYCVIRTGGYNKYSLLDELYKGCTSTTFTEESISKIKEYRNIIE